MIKQLMAILAGAVLLAGCGSDDPETTADDQSSAAEQTTARTTTSMTTTAPTTATATSLGLCAEYCSRLREIADEYDCPDPPSSCAATYAELFEITRTIQDAIDGLTDELPYDTVKRYAGDLVDKYNDDWLGGDCQTPGAVTDRTYVAICSAVGFTMQLNASLVATHLENAEG